MQRVCFLLLLSLVCSDIFNSTLVNYNVASLNYKAVGVPGDDRLVLFSALCQTYDTNGACINASQIIAIVYNSSSLQTLSVSIFFNPYQTINSRSIASFQNVIVDSRPVLENPYIYAVLNSYQNYLSPVVLRYELFPNSSLVALVPLRIAITAINGQLVDVQYPTSLVLDLNQSLLFSWGLFGSNFSLVRFNLTNSSVDKYIDSIAPSIPAHPQSFYSQTLGLILYDSDSNCFVALCYEVFLIEADNFTVVDSLGVNNGSISSGVIDNVRKRVYYLDSAGGALWRLSYNKTNIWRDFSYFYVASNEQFQTSYLLLDSVINLLYMVASMRFGPNTAVTPSLDIWDTSANMFDVPYKSIDLLQGAQRSDNFRPFAILHKSIVFTMNFAQNLSQMELIGLYKLVNGCPPGKNYDCIPCPPGTFYDAFIYACSPCDDFSYAPYYSMPACLPCALPTPARDNCTSCPEDQEAVGVKFCQCKAGYGVDSFTTCSKCASGTAKSQPGNSPCIFCALFAESTEDGTECVCPSNYFALIENATLKSCESCPSEANCNGSTYISGQATFWRPRDDGSMSFVQCPIPAACQADDTCAPQYDQSSFLCGACANGYSVSSSLEGCVACDAANWWIITLFCVLAPLLILRLYRSKSANSNAFVVMAILINHIQILAELGLDVSVAANIKSVFSFLSLFQFQFLSLSSSSCVFPSKTFFLQWLARLLVTIALLLLAGLTAGVIRLRSSSEAHLGNFVRVCVTVLKFCFIGNTKLVLMAFACASDDKRSDPSPYVKDGSAVTVFSYYPSLVCFSGEHATIFGVAIFFFLAYILGTILSMSFLLFKQTFVDISFLTGPYIPECKFWELVILTRRFAVAIVAATTQGFQRNWLLGLIMFLSLVGSIHRRPYLSSEWRWLDLVSLHILHATFLLGVLFGLKGADSSALFIFILILNFGFIFGVIVFSIRQAVKSSQQQSIKVELSPVPYPQQELAASRNTDASDFRNQSF